MGERGDLPKPGDVLAGKYAVVREIGEGGMASVFEARHRRLDSRVAIKVLRREARTAPEVVARFEREARAAVQLRGSHVARVFDVDLLDDGSAFMVMEYLEGCDLAEEVDRRGRLPMPEAVGYVLGACRAMSEAHSLGIIHRDLTPANIFLASCPEGRVVKVLDFGISKLVSDVSPSLTGASSTFGTPLYMSPEQIRSAHLVDVRTDVWSLGVVLYELLAGRPPFDGGSPAAIVAAIAADPAIPLQALRPDLPAALCAATMRALEKNAALRFRDVDTLANALLPFAGESLPAGASSSWRRDSAAAAVRTLPSGRPVTAPEYPALAIAAAALATIGAIVLWSDSGTVAGAVHHARLGPPALAVAPTPAIEHTSEEAPSATPPLVADEPRPPSAPRPKSAATLAAPAQLPTSSKREPAPGPSAAPSSAISARPAEPPPRGRVFRRTL